jgi:predicted dehydrogenase
MRPANFALLGCSHPHSRWHLTTLRLLPEVGSIWLWDPDADAARAAATEAGEKLAGTTDDLDALLGRGDLEFALVARRNDETPGTVARAARAGKHVLSEKPMATGPAALQPALDAARDAGVVVSVCYPWRTHPVTRDLRRLVAEGIFGRPLALEARLVTSRVRFRDPDHWLFQRAAAGGGILAWLGCHFLDLLRFLLQDEIIAVAALAGCVGGDAIEVEDTAALALQFAGGALGTFHAGYLLPRSVHGYRGAAYDTYLGLRGSEGTFSWQPTAKEQVVRLESADGRWLGAPEREVRYTLEPSEAYQGRHGLEFVREFIQAARAGVTPPATGEDALRVLEIIEAAYRSAETGSRAEVGG